VNAGLTNFRTQNPPVPTSATGHDGKPIQQTLVTLVTTSTLSQPNSYTYSDAKNVR